MKSMLFLANRLHNLLTDVNDLLTVVNPEYPAERSHSAQKPRLKSCRAKSQRSEANPVLTSPLLPLITMSCSDKSNSISLINI